MRNVVRLEKIMVACNRPTGRKEWFGYELWDDSDRVIVTNWEDPDAVPTGDLALLNLARKCTEEKAIELFAAAEAQKGILINGRWYGPFVPSWPPGGVVRAAGREFVIQIDRMTIVRARDGREFEGVLVMAKNMLDTVGCASYTKFVRGPGEDVLHGVPEDDIGMIRYVFQIQSDRIQKMMEFAVQDGGVMADGNAYSIDAGGVYVDGKGYYSGEPKKKNRSE